MPDARLERTRGTLPAGYQFGDAGSGPGSVVRVYDPLQRRVVEVHLPIDARPHGFSEFERADAFGPVHVHDFSRYDLALHAMRCACGESRQIHAGKINNGKT